MQECEYCGQPLDEGGHVIGDLHAACRHRLSEEMGPELFGIIETIAAHQHAVELNAELSEWVERALTSN